MRTNMANEDIRRRDVAQKELRTKVQNRVDVVNAGMNVVKPLVNGAASLAGLLL